MNKIVMIFPIATLFGSLGALFFKRGAERISDVKSVLLSYNLYIGGVCYVLASVLNIIVLKYIPYSVALPLTSSTYIWTIILSRLLLKERIHITQFAGIGLILLGSILIAM